jgi:hypothetical protein
MKNLALTLTFLCALCDPLSGQAVNTKGSIERSAKPSGTALNVALLWASPFEFTIVGSAFDFGSDVLLVADVGTRTLSTVHDKGLRIRTVGATGSGPSEYRQPQSLQNGGSGRARLVDPSLRRLSDIDATGSFVSQRAFPPGSNGLSGRVSSDGQGRLYFLTMPSDPRNSREVRLVRLDGTSQAFDTLTTLLGTQLADISVSSRKEPRGSQVRVSLLVVPFAPKDGFVTLESGETAVFRAEKKIIEWYGVDGKLLGSRDVPPPSTVPVQVSELNRIRPLALRELVPKQRLAFDVDFMVASNSGDIWIPRIADEKNSRTEWLVINRARREARRVVVPTRARLLLATPSEITVAESNDDDLERIARYSWR